MNDGWHLDRRVPISLIVAIVLQTGALIWWASSIESRVGALELSVDRHVESPIHDDAASRLTRVEARQELILQRINEISRKIDDL